MNKIYNFIFGMSDTFNNKPFCYIHYLNLKSCYITQNNPIIYIHCIHEPVNNIWWEQIKDFCTIIKHTTLPDIVYKCNNKSVWRIEHQSDIFRLLLLQEIGGVYADIDTFFYKPFFPNFLNKSCVLGIESLYHIKDDACEINGLCNALIISYKDSEFLRIWLDSYKNEYDSEDWNKMSVRKPYELAKSKSDIIHIEPASSFHKYNWNIYFYENNTSSDGMNWYVSRMSDSGIYSKHMSESFVYDTLKNMTSDQLKNGTSLFATMCQNVKGLL